MSAISKLFGDESKRFIKGLQPTVSKINDFEDKISSLSDDDLKNQTTLFKKRLDSGESLDDILSEAFATVREVSKRILGERHYDVQLLGGIVIHKGNITEMRTGEGKTLVTTLPAYLNALTGEGLHVVTVNDYLSRRDAVWMGQIYSFLGLSVGVINSDASYLYDITHAEGSEEDKERDQSGSFKISYEFLKPCSRKEAYDADITYGTNNEFGFDYLRDNIEYEVGNLRQRGYSYAIVDEIDSILIDEARTPLIISAPAAESGELYKTFNKIASTLKEEEDYEIDEKSKAITLTDNGIEKTEKILGVDNIYTDKGIKYVHHLETAVRAKALFKKDKQYVVKDGEVIIVDEFTGRLQPGRRWSEGLHQAVEAKEGVLIQKESRTFASITFQNYFRMYKKLSGMTGTAITSAEEFRTVYGLDTIEIPTHKPIARIDKDDLIFQNEIGKFKAVAKKIKELNKKGQPVLVGTVSIEKNELLSSFLQKGGIKHELLNAKNHEREGEIIAQAGEKGKVTIATNMAGRGVDIKLGGSDASKEQNEEVKKNGGLFVLGTERHDARRIDNQLRGRSGRQGDAGETQFFVSLEDSLMRVFASEAVKTMMGRLNIPEDEPIQNKMITKSLESAQKKIEGFNFDSRKHVLSYDNVLNKHRQVIYEKRNSFLKGDDSVLQDYIDNIVDNELSAILLKKKEEIGEEEFYMSIRRLMLQTTDMLWVEHLEVMDYMRGSVNLRAYGQRDPLIEYRKEGLRLFKDLEQSFDEQVVTMLPNITMGGFATEKPKAKAVYSSEVISGIKMVKKIGRNDIVTITNGTETKSIKYKKAEALLGEGGWKLVV